MMTTVVPRQLTEMFAYVIIDSEGEHLLGIRRGNNWQPLIASDEDHAQQLLPLARRAAKALGREAKLIRFREREDQPLI